MKKIWSMKKKDGVSPVIATILMVAITVVLAAVLYVMVMGFGGGQSGQTPTITMTYQKTDALNYTFTVAGVTKNDVPWGDITVVVNPAAAHVYPPAENVLVGAGDALIIVFSGAVSTGVTLKYEPTGGAMYQITLTPSA